MTNQKMKPNELTTSRKAFLINLDENVYGTFAEIGAGQEVARHFFRAGGAAGTIAKSMSAYDMKFSDEIYGKTKRYVSRERLLQMLDHEYNLLTERLAAERGKTTTFFVFANTVAAASYRNKKECHGWMGMRYQLRPETPPNDIIVHVRMLDKTAEAQQEALGVFGVNFIWAAVVYATDSRQFIESLLDNLDNSRIEVDMLEFRGPDFTKVNNRVVSLQLVECGLTNAVLFGPGYSVLQPSEIFYKKAILLQRGSFRPLTLVNTDMMEAAKARFLQEEKVAGKEMISLLEITMNNLLGDDSDIAYADYLARIEVAESLGFHVLVSNYREYYRLSSYFRRYTQEMIGVVMGINHLQAIFDENYYTDLDGGILESFGRLFKQDVRLYVYPMLGDVNQNVQTGEEETPSGDESGGSRRKRTLITADKMRVDGPLKHLYNYFIESRFIEPVPVHNEEHLTIYGRKVLQQIQAGDPAWEQFVPEPAARVIKERGYWREK